MPQQLIVAAVDFSEGSRTAFSQALRLARQQGARLLAVHVIPPIISPTHLLDDITVNSVSLQLSQGLEESAQGQLEQRCCQEAAPGEVEVRVLNGDPARELLALCQREKPSLLVVGSTGLSGLAEAVFGSVAAKLVRRAPCSVLVARQRPARSDKPQT